MRRRLALSSFPGVGDLIPADELTRLGRRVKIFEGENPISGIAYRRTVIEGVAIHKQKNGYLTVQVVGARTTLRICLAKTYRTILSPDNVVVWRDNAICNNCLSRSNQTRMRFLKRKKMPHRMCSHPKCTNSWPQAN